MEYLDEIISMRVKPSEKEKIKSRAAEQQMKVSSYIRLFSTMKIFQFLSHQFQRGYIEYRVPTKFRLK